MPTTLTTCPPAGTARAAVLAGLALGGHPNIVYIVNEFPTTSSSTGTLKRYDVTTGNKTEILNLSKTYISEAQVSTDGQWILFVAVASGQARRAEDQAGPPTARGGAHAQSSCSCCSQPWPV